MTSSKPFKPTSLIVPILLFLSLTLGITSTMFSGNFDKRAKANSSPLKLSFNASQPALSQTDNKYYVTSQLIISNPNPTDAYISAADIFFNATGSYKLESASFGTFFGAQSNVNQINYIKTSVVVDGTGGTPIERLTSLRMLQSIQCSPSVAQVTATTTSSCPNKILIKNTGEIFLTIRLSGYSNNPGTLSFDYAKSALIDATLPNNNLIAQPAGTLPLSVSFGPVAPTVGSTSTPIASTPTHIPVSPVPTKAPTPVITSTPTHKPTPTCSPRPACLDFAQPCMPRIPLGGWCTTTKTAPTPVQYKVTTPTPFKRGFLELL